MSVCMYVYMNVCMYICVCKCVYVRVCMSVCVSMRGVVPEHHFALRTTDDNSRLELWLSG